MASSGVIAELLRLDEEEKKRQREGPYQQQQQLMQGILQGLQLYDAVKSIPLKYGRDIKTTTPGMPATPPKEAVPPLTQGEALLSRQIPAQGDPFFKALLPQGTVTMQNRFGLSGLQGGGAPGYPTLPSFPIPTTRELAPAVGATSPTTTTQHIPGLYELQAAGEIGKILSALQVGGPGAAQLGQSLSATLGLAPGTTVEPRPQMVTIGAEKDPTSPTGYKAITVETPARSKVSPTMNISQKTQAEIDKEKREEDARIRAEGRKKSTKIEEEQRTEKRKQEETQRKAAMEVWKKGLDMKRKREPLPVDFREAFFNAGRTLGEDITPFMEEGSKGLGAALAIGTNKYINGFAKFRVPDGKGGFEEGQIAFDPLMVEEFKKRYPGAIEIP